MNPIIKIKENKYDTLLIHPNAYEEKAMISKTLFDVKYNNLKDTFIIEDDNPTYEFIKDNENIFNLLEEVKSSLNKHFSNEKYYLEVRCYPEIYENELTLIIKVDYSKEEIEKLNERLTAVFLEINDYKIELGLLGKFYLTMDAI